MCSPAIQLRKWSMLVVMALAGLQAVPAAVAQSWPTKPISLVVTFAPGGSSDIVARLIAGPLQAKLGQPVIVDNRPGAGGTIGAAAAARAAPDGYTLLLSNSAPISISPFMLTSPTYDPVKSFSHVSYIGSVANVFVVHPSVPAKTFPELIGWIKGQANPVNYGSGGIGSIGHIVGETMKGVHGLKMEHVGYKGSSPMHNDLLAGTIKLAIDTLPQNVPFMKDGKLRAVAVTSPSRASMAADVPSVLEFGEKKLVAENFLGISGPAGLPAPVADRLHSAMAEVLADATVHKRLDDLAVAGKRMSIAEFTAFVQVQVGEWAPAVRASGAKLN
jgi:tripartite-type tricarboxylate transporter receptor subunit TctC